MDKKYFLGVDGGATKSNIALIDEYGKLVFKKEGHCLNFRNIPEKDFLKNLSDILKKVGNRKILFGCFALAGVEVKKDSQYIRELINKNKLANFKFIVVNDLEGVMPSSNFKDGGVIIAGTGSNFFARNKNKIAKSGGLGYLLSDEGSAFYIGLKVLRASVKSYDGRGKKTLLEKMVLSKNKLSNIRDLVTKVYKPNFKLEVADYAILAQKGLKKRDAVSEEILLSAVNEIEIGIKTVINKVGLKTNFKVACVGGVLKDKFIFNQLKQRLEVVYPGIELIIVKNPELGAAKLAMKEFRRNSKN